MRRVPVFLSSVGLIVLAWVAPERALGGTPGRTPGKEPPALQLVVEELESGAGRPPALRLEETPLDDGEARALLDRIQRRPREEAEVSGAAPSVGSEVSSAVWAGEDRPLPATSEARARPLHGEALGDGEGTGPGVLSVSPEGEAPVNALPTVRFATDMVPLGTPDAPATPYATLEPPVPGTWRWIGTRTLLFDPAGRLPAANAFRLAVPAGLRDAAGRPLPAGRVVTFSTPRPTLVERFPADETSKDRQPIVVLRFDQPVPSQAAKFVRLEVGGKAVALRPASPQELEAAKKSFWWMRTAPPGTLLALRPRWALPPGARATVTVAAGLPSAEGPLASGVDHTFSFAVPPPFRVQGFACDRQEGTTPTGAARCPGSGIWAVLLTRPASSPGRGQVRLEPPVPDLEVKAVDDQVWFRGSFRPGRYRVVVSRGLRSESGDEHLARDEVLEVEALPSGPWVSGPTDTDVVVPRARAQFPVRSRGLDRLHFELRRVRLEDRARFQECSRLVTTTTGESAGVQRNWELEWISKTKRTTESPSLTCELPGEPIGPLEVPASRPEVVAETALPLERALPDGVGHVVAVVKGVAEPLWLQVTDLGVEAWHDATHAYVWVTSLETAKPIAGAEISVGGRSCGTTDAEGLLRFPLPDVETREVVVRHGADSVLAQLPLRARWRDAYRWYALLDRDVVRPGETVHARVLLRRIERTADGDLTTAGLPTKVRWKVVADSGQGERFAEGEAVADAAGGYTIEVAVPEGAPLGPADLWVTIPGQEKNPEGIERLALLRIEAYRRSEFQFELDRSEERVAAGDPVKLTATARYHSGSPLTGAEVSWSLREESSWIWFPAHREFEFGAAWESDRLFERSEDRYGAVRRPDVKPRGTTDGEGRHGLSARLRGLAPDEVRRLVAEVTITDGNGRTWSSSNRVQVYPAAVAVGVRTRPSFERPGELDAEAQVVDLDGRVVAGRPVRLAVERLEKVEGRKAPRVRRVGECRRTSGAIPVLCSFPSAGRGTLRVVAVTEDEQGRQHRTVAHPKAWEGDEAVTKRLELIPDRRSYDPGETARLRIAAPFAPAEGLITVVRGNVIRTQRITLETPRAEVEVPVGAGPELRVEVLLVAPMEAGVPRRALASVDLPVSSRDRRLAVSVRPRDTELLPGGETEVLLEARDARGRPAAGTTFTVVAVDEAVLALSAYRHPDPVEVLDAPWPTDSGRASIRDELPALSDYGHWWLSPPEGNYLLSRNHEPIPARSWFDPLALFAGAVTADAEGRATVRLRVPDSLTRYRIVALAADERRAGIGEASLSTGQPLRLRPSPPRFVRPGDRIDLPVIVENGGDRELETAVALGVRGARLEGPAGRRVVLAAGSRALVRFPLIADGPGPLSIGLAAAGGEVADAVELSIPVRPSTIRETAAAYGKLGAEPLPAAGEKTPTIPPVAAIELRRPPEARSGQGTLEVTAGGGGLAEAVGAARWLVAFPHDCAEQSSARLLGLLVLQKYGLLLPGQLDTPEALAASIDAEVKRLVSLQDHWGFRLWPGMDPESRESWFGTQAAHALIAAENAGVDFVWRRSRALWHLNPQYRRKLDELPPAEAARVMRVRAYELWVRSQAGNGRPSERREAARALAARDGLPAEAAALLLATLRADPAAGSEVARLVARLEASIREDPGSAHVLPERYGPGEFGSQVRADALALIGLDLARPGHPLADKLARGLLAARNDAGHWRNTQENAFALLALAPRLAREPESPGALHAWLGERYLGTVSPNRPVSLPLDPVPEEPTALVLEAPGGGPLHYRTALHWAVEATAVPPRERGFALVRSYEAVDDPGDVRRDEDGTVRIRAGSRVRVTLTGWTPVDRSQVAVVDSLPAGLEPLTPGFRGTQLDPEERRSRMRAVFEGRMEPGEHVWRRSELGDHVELGDDRALAFVNDLAAGRWSWSWTATAPTPGTFVAPPATVEAMYEPEVMARTAAERIVVEAR